MFVSVTTSIYAMHILGEPFYPLCGERMRAHTHTTSWNQWLHQLPLAGLTLHALLFLNLWDVCFFSVVIISFIF